MTTDFSRLYSLLGIQPGCSLEEFKQAYRRRIAELHPDRAMAGDRRDASAAAALNDLNSSYDSAMRFHKQHGRLPGAMPPAAPQRPEATIRSPAAAAAPAPMPTAAGESADDTVAVADDHARLKIALLLLLLSTVLGLLVWESMTQADATASIAASPGSHVDEKRAREALASHLELGMDKESVIAIQGNPVSVSGDDWYYGPSWLRFQDDQLADWHSSPLYRLKTGSTAQGPEPAAE